MHRHHHPCFGPERVALAAEDRAPGVECGVEDRLYGLLKVAEESVVLFFDL